ncbi:hypothetical protein C7M84_008910 [Penaeus vannamei]|uniref:Uncharacterized protein n=1 Tax=Penaeus vannamei TaxID=6689 RepID=A0A3R7MC94_PENVA|nr:hypothetical protein C7M84_008910 [Penaeus vannamei]
MESSLLSLLYCFSLLNSSLLSSLFAFSNSFPSSFSSLVFISLPLFLPLFRLFVFLSLTPSPLPLLCVLNTHSPPSSSCFLSLHSLPLSSLLLLSTHPPPPYLHALLSLTLLPPPSSLCLLSTTPPYASQSLVFHSTPSSLLFLLSCFFSHSRSFLFLPSPHPFSLLPPLLTSCVFLLHSTPPPLLSLIFLQLTSSLLYFIFCFHLSELNSLPLSSLFVAFTHSSLPPLIVFLSPQHPPSSLFVFSLTSHPPPLHHLWCLLSSLTLLPLAPLLDFSLTQLLPPLSSLCFSSQLTSFPPLLSLFFLISLPSTVSPLLSLSLFLTHSSPSSLLLCFTHHSLPLLSSYLLGSHSTPPPSPLICFSSSLALPPSSPLCVFSHSLLSSLPSSLCVFSQTHAYPLPHFVFFHSNSSLLSLFVFLSSLNSLPLSSLVLISATLPNPTPRPLSSLLCSHSLLPPSSIFILLQLTPPSLSSFVFSPAHFLRLRLPLSFFFNFNSSPASFRLVVFLSLPHLPPLLSCLCSPLHPSPPSSPLFVCFSHLTPSLHSPPLFGFFLTHSVPLLLSALLSNSLPSSFSLFFLHSSFLPLLSVFLSLTTFLLSSFLSFLFTHSSLLSYLIFSHSPLPPSSPFVSSRTHFHPPLIFVFTLTSPLSSSSLCLALKLTPPPLI